MDLRAPPAVVLCVAALASAACGRLGFDALSGEAVDAGLTVDAAPALLDEDITLPAGWTAEIYFDFSDLYTFDPAQYFDDPFTFSNRPHRLFVLAAPFAPGLGMVATWELYELQPDAGALVEHGYFQATTGGPEALWDAQMCEGFGNPATAGGLCVAAGSQGGGDGIFRVEADWSITQIDPINNATELAYDPGGVFGTPGVPGLLVGDPNGVIDLASGGTVFAGLINGGFIHLTAGGELMVSAGSPRRQLFRVAAGGATAQALLTVDSATTTEVARQNDGTIAIVTGGGAQMPGLAHAIVGGKQLMRVEDSGGLVEVARTAEDGDWIWSHAVAPPAAHPLGGPDGAFYILELNPVDEINRVIRIGPAP